MFIASIVIHYSDLYGYIFKILEGREALNSCQLLSKYYVILFLSLKINLHLIKFIEIESYRYILEDLASVIQHISRLCIHFLCVSIMYLSLLLVISKLHEYITICVSIHLWMDSLAVSSFEPSQKEVLLICVYTSLYGHVLSCLSSKYLGVSGMAD